MKFIITIILTGISLSIFAQDITLSGQIKEKTSNRNIEYATVSVLSQNKILITGAVTNNKGYFTIPLSSGNYQLICSYVGYTSDTLRISIENQDVYLGIIRIKPDSTKLQEVEISASSKSFKIDKDAFIATEKAKIGTSNAKELLERLNGISYDRFNNLVKVDNNSNVVFLVNGLEKNKDYIQNLSPDRIKKIEVLRDPGGRYALEGYYAIINIILKNDYQGNELYVNDKMLLDLDGKYLLPLNDIDINYNYTHNKINTYGQFKNYYNDFHIISSVATEYPDYTISETPLKKNEPNTVIHEIGNSFTAGVDYYINPKHIISFEGNYSDYPLIFDNSTQYNSTTSQNNLITDSYYYINTNSKKSKNLYGSLFYTGKLSKNDKIEVSFNYSNDDNIYDNSITRDQITTNEFLNSKNNRINSFFEYNRTLRKNLTLQVGYGNKLYDIKNNYTTDTTDSLIQKQDYFIKEMRQLFYSYLSWKINKSLSLKIGFSTENSNKTDENHRQNYYIFQPHLDFLYSVSDNFKLTLKFRSTGNYPTMKQTDPNTIIIDPNTIKYGNPKLKPYVFNRLSLRSTIYHGLFAIEPYLHFSKNYIVEIGKTLNDNVFAYSYDNSANYQNIGLKFNLTIPFSKKIILQSGFDIYEGKIVHNNITNSLIDWTNSTQLIYADKKNGNVAGLLFQKNMSKNIIAQGYNTSDNDFWMIFLSKPFMKKRLNVMISYVLPINFLVDYKSENYIMTPDYSRTQITDVNLLKNMIIFKLNYRFNKGRTRKQTEKKSFKEKREKSGIF